MSDVRIDNKKLSRNKLLLLLKRSEDIVAYTKYPVPSPRQQPQSTAPLWCKPADVAPQLSVHEAVQYGGPTKIS